MLLSRCAIILSTVRMLCEGCYCDHLSRLCSLYSKMKVAYLKVIILAVTVQIKLIQINFFYYTSVCFAHTLPHFAFSVFILDIQKIHVKIDSFCFSTSLNAFLIFMLVNPQSFCVRVLVQSEEFQFSTSVFKPNHGPSHRRKTLLIHQVHWLLGISVPYGSLFN